MVFLSNLYRSGVLTLLTEILKCKTLLFNDHFHSCLIERVMFVFLFVWFGFLNLSITFYAKVNQSTACAYCFFSLINNCVGEAEIFSKPEILIYFIMSSHN